MQSTKKGIPLAAGTFPGSPSAVIAIKSTLEENKTARPVNSMDQEEPLYQERGVGPHHQDAERSAALLSSTPSRRADGLTEGAFNHDPPPVDPEPLRIGRLYTRSRYANQASHNIVIAGMKRKHLSGENEEDYDEAVCCSTAGI